MSSQTLDWLLPLLVCPVCRTPLAYAPDAARDDGILYHRGGECGERYPVIEGIPRLLTGAHRPALVRAKAPWFDRDQPRRELAGSWARASSRPDDVVAGFDFEWALFADVGTKELGESFGQYFDLVPPDAFAPDRIVVDAGCGAGRWAYEVARRGPRVIALDLGASVEVAHANTRALGRVACVQADLLDLPLADGAVDWAYTLGVLHHLADPAAGVANIARAVRPGGLVLLYLYYALDGRGPAYRALFAAADAIRRVTSQLPRPMVLAIATLIAVLVYWPLARIAAVCERVGLSRLARDLPLAFYRRRSLRLMLNDSLDRFGTRVERRFRREEIAALLHGGGLADVLLSPGPPFWHGLGRRVTSASARPSR